MLALSLDMGGTHIGCGLVRDNELLASSSLDSEPAQSLESLLPAVAAELKKMLQQCGLTAEECHGITIGFPGIVDARRGLIKRQVLNRPIVFVISFTPCPSVWTHPFRTEALMVAQRFPIDGPVGEIL